MTNKLEKIAVNRSVKNGGLYLLGNLFNKAISFMTIPVFTRILSTTEYGIASTYSSWVSILSVIIGLSLGNSIRNAYVDFPNDLDGYISSILTLSSINFVIVLFLTTFLNSKFMIVNMALLFMCQVQSFANFVINSLIVKYMMIEESLKRTALLVIPNFSAAIVSVILIMKMKTNKEYGRIFPMFFVTSLFGTVILCFCLCRGKQYVNKKYWNYAMRISIPLIFHGLSVNILSNSDRTILTAFRSAAETGIYSVVYNLGMIALVVTSSLENVWIPFFTKNMINDQRDRINRYSKIYVEICTIFFCGILVIAPEVLVLFASEKYRGGVRIIAPVVLASYFQFLYSFAVDTEYYYKRTKMIAINTIIAAVINLALNFIFIPKGGALAAAYTTVIAYILSFVVHYKYCKKIDEKLFPISSFTLPLCMIIVFTFFQYITMEYMFIRWFFGISIIILYMLIIYQRERKLE